MTRYRYRANPGAGMTQGTLGTLRDVMPPRALTQGEALRIAELQAQRFLEISGVKQLPVPMTVITDLPKIVVQRMVPAGIGCNALDQGHLEHRDSWQRTVGSSSIHLGSRVQAHRRQPPYRLRLPGHAVHEPPAASRGSLRLLRRLSARSKDLAKEGLGRAESRTPRLWPCCFKLRLQPFRPGSSELPR